MRNREGLTFQEWLRAAGVPAGTRPTDKQRKDWNRGVDPSEWRATSTSGPLPPYADELAEGMARGLWGLAYVDYADSNRGDKSIERPGRGGDWSSVMPETPEAAENCAKDLIGLYEAANATSIAAIIELAKSANRAGDVEFDAEQLGVCLAHMAVGSGLSWFDDNPSFKLKLPFFFECHYDGDTLTWNGDTQPLYMNPSNPLRGARGSAPRGKPANIQMLVVHPGRDPKVEYTASPLTFHEIDELLGGTAETLDVGTHGDRIIAWFNPDGERRRFPRNRRISDASGKNARTVFGTIYLTRAAAGPRARQLTSAESLSQQEVDKYSALYQTAITNPAGNQWLVLCVNSDPSDTHAVKYSGDLNAAITEAAELAGPDARDALLYAIVEARDAGAARITKPPGGWKLYKGKGAFRDNPGLRYPLVCTKCTRAIRKVDLGRIGIVYKDTHEAERCPRGGEHEPS